MKAQLRTHLDTKHQELVPRTQQKIISAVHQDASLQPGAIDEDDIVYPSPAFPPLPHLPVYQDGLQCSTCGRIYRHIKRMQKHCRQQHAWKGRNRGAAGRPAGTNAMWTTGIVCQKFHSTSSLGRLFEVSASASVEAQHVPAHPDADVRQAIGLSLTQAATQSENLEKEKNAAIQADTDRYDFNEWLNRAGWARHLKGLQRDWLLRMAQKPTYNVLRERECEKGEGEREGKEGPGTGPKETTEREGKTSCTGMEHCAFIPNNPSYNLKETGTQKEEAACYVSTESAVQYGKAALNMYHNAIGMDERCGAIMSLGGRWCRCKAECLDLKGLPWGSRGRGPHGCHDPPLSAIDPEDSIGPEAEL
jgi:hypothetical protein